MNVAAVSWLTARRAPTAALAVVDRDPPPVYVAPPWATPAAAPAAASALPLAPAAPSAPAPDLAMAAEASARAAHALGDRIIAAAIKRPQHRLSRGTVAPVELFSGIRALAELVSTCAGEGRPTSAPGASRDQAVLLLEVETLDGKVRIVDAAVQTRGSASEAVIRCAQRELRGQEIAVEISQSGGRFQLPFTLRI